MPRTAKRTLEGWKQHKRHEVTLPSGYVIEMEIPNLPQMIKTGHIPNDLVKIATDVLEGKVKITPEIIAEHQDFYRKLILMSVKEPALSEDDLDDIPFEDQELIVAIATRQTDMDAEYRQLGGLHKSKTFRSVRGIFTFDSDVDDDEGGG